MLGEEDSVWLGAGRLRANWCTAQRNERGVRVQIQVRVACVGDMGCVTGGREFFAAVYAALSVKLIMSALCMQGDATYLITKEDGTLEPFGVNAVCTHLGCVVPWNKSLNRFACPCHGSQYDKNGKV